MRILFVRLSSFGDVLFALPTAKALQTALPSAHLTWAIEPPLAPLVEGAAYVDAVLPVDTRGWRRSLGAARTREEIREFLRRVRGADFDLVVDAQGLFKSALVSFAAPRAPRKVGFGWKTATERVNCLVTDEHVNVDRTARPHVLDQMLALAEHVTGRTGFERVPDVRHLVERPDPVVDEWLERFGSRPLAVLQPFASKGNKEWPDEEVVATAGWLAATGLQPIVRWGPGEESRASELLLLSKQSSSSSLSSLTLLLAPATTPASTARLAARARLFVGADTGPTHLAAAAGTPTLALFGPTPPERYGPVGPRTAVLRESAAAYNRSGARWPAEDVRDAALPLLT
jgi:lipopolysaccharide heptosyltransferase I